MGRHAGGNRIGKPLANALIFPAPIPNHLDSGKVAETESSVRQGKVFLLLALLIFGLLQVLLAAYIVDDTFIHLTFARNLASGHGFAFNPDQPAYGVTAPLWTLLLACFSLVATPGPGLAKLLSIFCGALTIPAFRSLSRRFGLNGMIGQLSLLVWASNVWLARWSASGMEASFAVLLLILAFDAHFAGRSLVAGLLLGLASLTRPEAIGLLLIFSLDRSMRGEFKAAWLTIASGSIPIMVWLGYAFWNFGTIIPNPALIKSDVLLPPLTDVLLGLKRTTAILFGSNGLEILVILASLAAIIVLSSPPQLSCRFAGLLFIWAIFPAFTYISRGVFVQSRYLLIGIPPLIIGGYLSLKWLLGSWNELMSRRVLYLFTVLLLAQQLLLTRFVTLPHVESFNSTMSALVQISARIDREAAPDALVAVGDVGVVGFYCGRRVLDLEGLVSSEIVPYRIGTSLDQFILSGLFFKAGSPDYIIDKSRDPRRLENKWNAEVLQIFPVPGGLIDSADQSWNYTLYRIPG